MIILVIVIVIATLPVNLQQLHLHMLELLGKVSTGSSLFLVFGVDDAEGGCSGGAGGGLGSDWSPDINKTWRLFLYWREVHPAFMAQ